MATSRSSAPKKRPVTVDDLLDLAFVGSGDLSPDGSLYAFTVRTVRKNLKGYDSRIHVADTDGSRVRAFTHGKRSDGAPVFSPEGGTLAFVARRGARPGIHLLPVDGGEARPLVTEEGSFSGLTFSPDGSKIACVFRPSDPPPGKPDDEEGDEEKPPKREAPLFRHITRLFYRLDGAGFLPVAEGQIHVYDVESGEGGAITGEKWGALDPAWSPDGRTIAYVSSRAKDPDLESDRQELFVVRASGGPPRRISTPPGPLSAPRFSPDGKKIAYLGHDDLEAPWYEVHRVWTVPVRGGKARCLSPRFAYNAFDETISDVGAGFFVLPPAWSRDGRWIHFVASANGSTCLYRVRAGGGDPERLTAERQHLQGVSVAPDGRVAAGIVSTVTSPPEIRAFDLPAPRKRGARSRTQDRSVRGEAITSFNAGWARRIDIQRPKRVRIRSTEGTRVEGWILTPPGVTERSRKKHPAIVEVHGGPQTQYGWSFFHEMQVLAAKGYVVYYSNPRGSAGYGRAFCESIRGRWGTRDYEDVMAGAEHVASLPYVDEKRIGITGGSYGGFMTNWAVGHTRRFRAAVTQRSVVDMRSFFGSSDVGFRFDIPLGQTPWDDPERRLEAQSPLTYVKKIRTPLLIIHSENDLRCNVEQAEQLFAALKTLGRRTELVRFPEESHGLSRDGRPDRRKARLEKILEWFERYL